MDRQKNPPSGAPSSDKGPRSSLKDLRDERNWNQTQLGNAAGLSQRQISILELHPERMTLPKAQRLGRALGVNPADLMQNGRFSIPIAVAIALADFPDRPPHFDLPEPKMFVQSPMRLEDPQDCFAADVYDDSADLLYPAGSTLIVRRLDCVSELRLVVGDKVLVRSFAGSRHEGATHQVLIGLLDRSITGDLLLLTRSNNRNVPSSIVIQRGSPRGGINERVAKYRASQERQTIDYEPTPFDPAEILGRIVFAITPE